MMEEWRWKNGDKRIEFFFQLKRISSSHNKIPRVILYAERDFHPAEDLNHAVQLREKEAKQMVSKHTKK